MFMLFVVCVYVCMCRYGVREFVLITPEKGVESLTSQAQVKLMLSTVSIAIANTQWCVCV